MDSTQAMVNVQLAQAHVQLVQMVLNAHHAKTPNCYREHYANLVVMMVISMNLELVNNVLQDAISVQETILAPNVVMDIS